MFEEPIEINITEQDVIEGCRGTERYCIVSTAIGRIFPNATRIETNVDTIRFTMSEDGKKYRIVYRTPDVVRDYVVNFDHGQEADPMDLWLEEPEVTELTPKPKGQAKTPSFKAKGAPSKHRSVRVFGERAFVLREDT